ncbi:MAG: hypothetical protein AB7T37_16685 [Dehalococcoidia bacterium]
MSAQPIHEPTTAIAPWQSLAIDGPLLAEAIAHRFESMASMAPQELRASTAELLDFEASLPGERLRFFFIAKLKAFTMVEASTAQAVMEEINVFLSSRPAEMLMRRQVALQGASRELTLDEISHLESLLPSIRELAGLPPRKYAPEVSMVGPEPRPVRKRPFWKAFLRA